LTKLKSADFAKRTVFNRPTREAAEDAVRTLLAWAGDDPARDGLVETPRRVVEAYEDYFSGYRAVPADVLGAMHEETAGYRDMVLLRDIRVASHCEHHIAPFIGVAHVAYLPNGQIVGLSRLARIVDVFSRRLQTQENLTAVIADAIESELQTAGVAIMISAEHHCMSMRGIRQHGVTTLTSEFRGAFETDVRLKDRFVLLTQSAR
jgi:GTP cyclohydrolase IA